MYIGLWNIFITRLFHKKCGIFYHCGSKIWNQRKALRFVFSCLNNKIYDNAERQSCNQPGKAFCNTEQKSAGSGQLHICTANRFAFAHNDNKQYGKCNQHGWKKHNRNIRNFNTDKSCECNHDSKVIVRFSCFIAFVLLQRNYLLYCIFRLFMAIKKSSKDFLFLGWSAGILGS